MFAGGEAIQVGLCCSFPGIIFNYIADRKNSIESLSVEELITSSLISIGIHIAEFAAIYGIGKGIKKLFSSSKKSNETKNI